MLTNYPDPVTIANALYDFAQAVDRALAWLPQPGLIAPDCKSFALRPGERSELVATAPVIVAPNVAVDLIVPFPQTSGDKLDVTDELCSQFTSLLAGLEEHLALRADLERRLREIFKPSVHGRLLAVRLAPIDLQKYAPAEPFEVHVEGDADDMLRASKAKWRVCDVDDAIYYFNGFQRDQEKLVPLRDRARALGAVGFVDPLALALAARLPCGQRLTLCDVARRRELFWDMSSVARCESTLLWWRDGVVQGNGRLNEEVLVAGEYLEVTATIDEVAVGSELRDYVDLPRLAAYRITSVTPRFDDRTRMMLDAQPVPFGADGQLLQLE